MYPHGIVAVFPGSSRLAVINTREIDDWTFQPLLGANWLARIVAELQLQVSLKRCRCWWPNCSASNEHSWRSRRLGNVWCSTMEGNAVMIETLWLFSTVVYFVPPEEIIRNYYLGDENSSTPWCFCVFDIKRKMIGIENSLCSSTPIIIIDRNNDFFLRNYSLHLNQFNI